jgi:hypothetical protein
MLFSLEQDDVVEAKKVDTENVNMKKFEIEKKANAIASVVKGL